jgi:hypothetical protein
MQAFVIASSRNVAGLHVPAQVLTAARLISVMRLHVARALSSVYTQSNQNEMRFEQDLHARVSNKSY